MLAIFSQNQQNYREKSRDFEIGGGVEPQRFSVGYFGILHESNQLIKILSRISVGGISMVSVVVVVVQW